MSRINSIKDNKGKICFIITAVILAICIIAVAIYLPITYAESDDAVMTIRSGASGTIVKDIQKKLNEKGYSVGTVDGIFGSKTVSAVKKFQSDNGLTSDGIVGSRTAEKLGVDISGGSSGNSNYTGSDVYLLAKCIHAEARGEPYIGQVAVGSVVLNRVASSKFPNSISGVIYQPWAFTAVHDGQMNLEPNEEAKRAARDAMNGWDPSNGCIYYFNPATATSDWIWSRQVQLTIGRHKFAI